MVVSVISAFDNFDSSQKRDSVDYYDVKEFKLLEKRALIHAGNKVIQVPLDGRHSILIR